MNEMTTKQVKKMTAGILLCLAMLIAFITTPLQAEVLKGSGTEADPYVINNASDLEVFASMVDSGEDYTGKYIVLGGDIDLDAIASWNPIGAEGKSTDNAGKIFNGTFDGKGYTISNLKINANEAVNESNHGLFSTLASNAVVKNVNVTNAAITVENKAEVARAGVIAGDATGARIDNCSATGSVKVTTTGDKISFAAGILGRNVKDGIITNCWSDVTVTSTSTVGTKNSYAAGIVGMSGNNSLVANCATFGNVSASSPQATNYGGQAGGVIGMMAGKQYNTYATGDVTIGNGGLRQSHVWVGALDGQVTTTGMEENSDGTYQYPATGAVRTANYYASDVTLKMDVYNGSNKTSNTLETKALGYPGTTMNVDTVMSPIATTKANMAKTTFADTLNMNIQEVSNIIKAYGIEDIQLRDWQMVKSKALPNGEVWTSGEIDASIFAGGTGTEADPYLIKTTDQLNAFAGSLNAKIDYTGAYIALDNDITLTGTWNPIGGSDYLFNGTFDGKDYKISGMTLGTKDAPAALDSENLYIGLFGILGPKSVVKNVNLTEVSLYTTYAATAYLGGIAGVTQGSTSRGDYTGAIIDNCTVSGALSHTGEKGNQFVGGIAGMEYKGAIINCSSKVDISCVVISGDLAEAGGLVALNNRGLVANSWSDSTIYGSGSRENGKEGMATVSNLVACNAGDMVNCYASGDVTTKEHSTYAGMVSGWVTGIGKTYNCHYNLDSTMIVGKDTSSPLVVNPVESIGTKVASGVSEDGDAYTGGLIDKVTGYKADTYAAIADSLNNSFAAFPISITKYGISDNSLNSWFYDTETKTVTFGDKKAKAVYVQPDCEKVIKEEAKMKDGIWYGRNDEKTTVVKITVKDNAVIGTEVVSGTSSGKAFTAALEKAKYKATYGDFSDYAAADTSKFTDGKGTEAEPFLIANEEQLRYLSSSVNADVDWSGIYFKQTANITLKDGDWQPIGWTINAEINGKKTQVCAYPFRGNYDGGNYTIYNLTIGTKDAPTDQAASGLFGLTSGELKSNDKPTGEEQVIRLSNIHLENVNINVATRYETFTGGLVGSGQYGIYIDNCSVTGAINTTTQESFCRGGGIAASVLRGAVTNCWADVDINSVTDSNHVYIGGLYGMDNRVTTINSYALGDVTGNSSNNNKVHLGGLTGQAGGVHINCYAAGDVVSFKTTTDVGGLNGRLSGICVEYNCYFNSSALLKQGDTVCEAKGSGVEATNSEAIHVEGKTAEELGSKEFAALLNSNIEGEKLAASIAEVNDVLENSKSGLTQKNYYENNILQKWEVLKNGVVGFDTAIKDDPAKEMPFTDVTDNDWFKEDVAYAYAKGLMIGVEETKFAPNETTNRAMIVTILYRLEGTPEVGETSFKDVETNTWYTKAVAWAEHNNIVNGYGDGNFGPMDKITREQMATILYRYAELKGMDISASADLSAFTDAEQISDYAQKAISWANASGLIKGMGDSTLNPQGNALRCHVAAIFHRFLTK